MIQLLNYAAYISFVHRLIGRQILRLTGYNNENERWKLSTCDSKMPMDLKQLDFKIGNHFKWLGVMKRRENMKVARRPMDSITIQDDYFKMCAYSPVLPKRQLSKKLV